MMNRYTITFATLGFAAVAAAGPVEPDAFSDGTDISNNFAGVTLSTTNSEFGTVPIGAIVFSETAAAGYATTGTRVFANSFSFAPDRWGSGRPNMRADFASGSVSSVSIDIIGDNGSDFGFLSVFRTDNSLIQRVETAALTNLVSQTLSIFSGANDIAYAIMGGKAGDAVYLDNMNFADNPLIPLPTGAAMAMVGMGLVAVRRRRG